MISASTIMKAAIALFNTLMTGSTHALFRMVLAGRTWPFVEKPLAALPPNSLSIDGLTVTTTVDVVRVDARERIGDFLCRLE